MALNVENNGWQGSPELLLKRAALLFALVLLLLILSAFPIPIANLGEIRPDIMLIAIYYWATLRPDVLSPLSAFFAGFVLDLLTGAPLGLQALTLVAVQWTTRSQRKFLQGQNFAVLWAGFGLLAFGAALLQWIFFMLFYLEVISLKPALFSGFLTALLFPLVVWPLSAFNKALAVKPSAGA